MKHKHVVDRSLIPDNLRDALVPEFLASGRVKSRYKSATIVDIQDISCRRQGHLWVQVMQCLKITPAIVVHFVWCKLLLPAFLATRKFQSYEHAFLTLKADKRVVDCEREDMVRTLFLFSFSCPEPCGGCYCVPYLPYVDPIIYEGSTANENQHVTLLNEIATLSVDAFLPQYLVCREVKRYKRRLL